MAKAIVKLTFPEELVKEPLTFTMAKKYDVMPNIRRARVSETAGELILEIEGNEENVEEGLRFLSEKGVTVEHIPGDILGG